MAHEVESNGKNDEGVVRRRARCAGLGETRAIEQRFLGEHLLVWTPDFCHNLHERAQCGLYRGLASSLSQFLALEREDFEL